MEQTTLGKIFHQLRLSKGFTLQDACQDHLSIGLLSRFEKGTTRLTLEKFLHLLENINVTWEEFFFLAGAQREKNLHQRFGQIIQWLNQQDWSALKTEQQALLAAAKTPYCWERFLADYIEMSSKRSPLTPHPLLPANHPVLTYLQQVETWGEMELQVYNLFASFLPPDKNQLFLRTALKRSALYLELPKDQELFFELLHNHFALSLSYGDFTECQKTLTILSQQLQETIAARPQINYLFDKGLLALRQKNFQQGKLYCQQALSVCRIFRYPELEAQYAAIFNMWWERRHEETCTIQNLQFNTFNSL